MFIKRQVILADNIFGAAVRKIDKEIIMILEWDFVISLESENLIDEFEKLVKYKFPRSFRKCVKMNNAGYPSKEIFVTAVEAERCIEHLLSFNRSDCCSIWDELEAYESNIKVAEQYNDIDESKMLQNIIDNYVIFAEDPGGNQIAFKKIDDSVVYIDHENLEVEHIADSFDEFLDCLYD